MRNRELDNIRTILTLKGWIAARRIWSSQLIATEVFIHPNHRNWFVIREDGKVIKGKSVVDLSKSEGITKMSLLEIPDQKFKKLIEELEKLGYEF